MVFKRISAAALALALCLGVLGCGFGAPSGQTPDAGGTEAQTEATATAEPAPERSEQLVARQAELAGTYAMVECESNGQDISEEVVQMLEEGTTYTYVQLGEDGSVEIVSVVDGEAQDPMTFDSYEYDFETDEIILDTGEVFSVEGDRLTLDGEGKFRMVFEKRDLGI